jgi:hypothetical protein
VSEAEKERQSRENIARLGNQRSGNTSNDPTVSVDVASGIYTKAPLSIAEQQRLKVNQNAYYDGLAKDGYNKERKRFGLFGGNDGTLIAKYDENWKTAYPDIPKSFADHNGGGGVDAFVEFIFNNAKKDPAMKKFTDQQIKDGIKKQFNL